VLQHELFLHKLHKRERAIHIDELCNAGYVINRDAFTETLINATIPYSTPRKGFWNKALKKNVELNARVGEWRDTDVYIYAQCTSLSSGSFESTRTSRGPLKAPVRAGWMTGKKSKYAMTAQMKYPCLLMAAPDRLEQSKRGASLPRSTSGYSWSYALVFSDFIELEHILFKSYSYMFELLFIKWRNITNKNVVT